MKNLSMGAVLAAASLIANVAYSAPAATGANFAGHRLAPLARLSIAQARGAALKARPGRITAQELEKEKGGSGLRYSFDIANAGHTYEVGIDAHSGAVLENGAESAHPD